MDALEILERGRQPHRWEIPVLPTQFQLVDVPRMHYAYSFDDPLPVFVCIQGFREKNRDLLRSDIVNVLQASRMDLVRALIGLPPYTVYRWHMAYLKVMAAFAFR